MKQILTPLNAAFNATGKTITFSGTIPASISHIYQVANVTTGTLMFQPQGGFSLAGTFSAPVLTLNCSTVGMADTDKLFILWDDGTYGIGAAAGVTRVNSTAPENSRIFKNSAGTLLSLMASSSLTTGQYIHIFDSATLPPDGTVPTVPAIPMPATWAASLDVSITGMPFLNGITVCNSTTQHTKTIGAANCLFAAVIK